ncbi:serine protease inhibitor 3/4-like [Musca vetustissima]|uniref:serine protease inhibitor 3/4-like n=1 Tax=Musca vetustissima TaxID=27455 RepID=UPI002AB759D7|nr:serine protease inhibitor 3/4-like [Musca vetustissima]
MGVNTHFIAIICVMIVTVIVASPTTTSNEDSQLRDLSKSLQAFGTKLYSSIAKNSGQKNILFSPFSIETSLAMMRLGATGQTAQEIDNDQLELRDQFNELLEKNFFASAENVNFTQNIKTAEKINSWVEAKTNHLITDLISADDLDENTRVVLLNAIYFKGEWLQPFFVPVTRQKNFYVDATNYVSVEMMLTFGQFRYGKIDQLDATAVAMPYKNTDLYMIVILPNSRDGLDDLRIKLQSYSLQELRDNMAETMIQVEMPKFKTEYKIELSEILERLGIERLFTDAELDKMIISKEGLQVSKVLHKAIIEVNEKGTEAAAATGMY